MLPSSVVIRMRTSSADSVALLKQAFSGKFDEAQSEFRLIRDDLVQSNGAYFRRVNFEFRTLSSKGTWSGCGQQVFMWFSQDGALAGNYVDQSYCLAGAT